jgi:hypothetical protein
MIRTIKLEGTEELRKAIIKLSKEGRKEIKKEIDKTGLSLRGSVIKKYQRGPATGIIYTKYDPKRIHQASAPGEAPATDTGLLANSVTFKEVGPLEVEVLTEVEYGEWLEFGTASIEPRPNWVPSVQEEQPKFIKRLEAGLKRAMNK